MGFYLRVKLFKLLVTQTLALTDGGGRVLSDIWKWDTMGKFWQCRMDMDTVIREYFEELYKWDLEDKEEEIVWQLVIST